MKMRCLTLFSHDFPLHVPQDETHSNPCLPQEQIDIENLLLSALHLHLTNWSLTSSDVTEKPSLAKWSKSHFDPNTWSSSTPNPKRIGVRAVLVDDFMIAWPMLCTFTSDWIKTRNSFWRLFGIQSFEAMSSILG